MGQQPEFSVIVTCYREEHSIREFHGRLTSAMQSMGRDYEIVMINDGSPDGTLDILRAIYEEDANTKVLIDFCSNSGQASAHTAGVEAARGQALIFIDSDLQLDPEDIPKLASAYDKGLDLVGGRRACRQDVFLRKTASWLANYIMQKLTGTRMRDIFCCFKIINAQTVKALGYGPHRLFRILEVMRYCPRCEEVEVAHHPRPYDKSGWTYPRLLSLLIDGIFICIGNPFRKIMGAGLFLVFLAVLYLLAPMAGTPRLKETLEGTRLAASLMLLIPAFTLLVFGVTGEYLYQMRKALCATPHYIIRSCLDKRGEGGLS